MMVNRACSSSSSSSLNPPQPPALLQKMLLRRCSTVHLQPCLPHASPCCQQQQQPQTLSLQLLGLMTMTCHLW